MPDAASRRRADPRTARARRKRDRRGCQGRGGERRADDRPACLGSVPAATDTGSHGTGRHDRSISGSTGRMTEGMTDKMPQLKDIRLTVNGKAHEGRCEPRLLLVDFLRDNLSLTGTHVGCEHGVCGACTILFNGEAARSCLMFAVQADGADIVTVEGLA